MTHILNRTFNVIVVFFVISLGVALIVRGGKDLKVDLFGAMQTLQHKSPYDNPNDPGRPIFRYAPGFAAMVYPFILKSVVVRPLEFEHMAPSIFAWYCTTLFSLAASAFLLFKLIPVAPGREGLRHLKTAFLLSMPLVAYELSNSQNKLLALCFILAALYFFEQNKMFRAAVFLNLALTIYIPLFVFIIYFIVRNKKTFIPNFIAACALVFVVIPSLVFGFHFNLFLLKEWFQRSIQPFAFTSSYESYIDLRPSSQSLPSAIGRVLVQGTTGHFHYLISPTTIHFLIRACSALLLLISCLAVRKQPAPSSRGLQYLIFLVLALVMPQYCIYYSWSWSFAFFFIILNYTGDPAVPPHHRSLLRALGLILFINILLLGIRFFTHFSFLLSATLLIWAGAVFVLFQMKQNRPCATSW